MKKLIFLSLITFGSLIHFACPGTVRQGAAGEISSAKIHPKCTKPAKRYAKDLDTKVKAKVSELKSVPEAELDASVKTTVVKLADYTSEGLDRDLVLFRICEMSLNRGLTNAQTVQLIETAIKAWDEEENK